MSPRRFLYSLCLSTAPVVVAAQKPVVYKEPRILLLVDGSSSMLQNWDTKENRFQTAGRFIDALMDSMYRINPNVAFGLRVYGQQSPAQDNNCFDTKREVMFSKNNRDQMSLRLASLHPYGVSPIAYSLQRAAEEDLTEEYLYSYSIILITDGGESCGGDLCAISKALQQRAIFFQPYIVSLVDYAPLKDQYQCLGEYLTAAKQEQVKPTLKTILDAYRPVLRAVSETPVETSPRPKPPVVVTPPKPVPTPPVVITEKAMAALPFLRSARPFAVQFSPIAPPARRTVPALKAPARIPDEPVAVVAPPPVRIEIATLPFRSPVLSFPAAPAGIPIAHVRAIPSLSRPAPEEEPTTVAPLAFILRPPTAEVPKAPLARVLVIPTLSRPAPEEEPTNLEPLTFVLRRQRIAEMTPPVFAARTRTIPTLPRPKPIEDPKPPVAATPPKPKPNDKPEPIEFNARTERASQSGILVFFTNGKGKYYKSTPQVEVRDAKTNQLVKRFYRTVGPDDKPDLQPVPPGVYNVVVPGKSNVMARNIPIGENETMNLQLVVTNGSLRFSYSSNAKRLMTEFDGSVVRRFADNNAIVKQKGTEELPYEPGNYYLELNTLPVTRRNLDIEFGSVTDVQIAEPGWVQFTNLLPPGGKLVLYQPLGDGFASFYKMETSGDLAQQKIRLQPGTYEVRFTSSAPGSVPVAVRFVVESNKTTMTEVK